MLHPNPLSLALSTPSRGFLVTRILRFFVLPIAVCACLVVAVAPASAGRFFMVNGTLIDTKPSTPFTNADQAELKKLCEEEHHRCELEITSLEMKRGYWQSLIFQLDTMPSGFVPPAPLFLQPSAPTSAFTSPPPATPTPPLPKPAGDQFPTPAPPLTAFAPPLAKPATSPTLSAPTVKPAAPTSTAPPRPAVRNPVPPSRNPGGVMSVLSFANSRSPAPPPPSSSSPAPFAPSPTFAKPAAPVKPAASLSTRQATDGLRANSAATPIPINSLSRLTYGELAHFWYEQASYCFDLLIWQPETPELLMQHFDSVASTNGELRRRNMGPGPHPHSSGFLSDLPTETVYNGVWFEWAIQDKESPPQFLWRHGEEELKTRGVSTDAARMTMYRVERNLAGDEFQGVLPYPYKGSRTVKLREMTNAEFAQYWFWVHETADKLRLSNRAASQQPATRPGRSLFVDSSQRLLNALCLSCQTSSERERRQLSSRELWTHPKISTQQLKSAVELHRLVNSSSGYQTVVDKVVSAELERRGRSAPLGDQSAASNLNKRRAEKPAEGDPCSSKAVAVATAPEGEESASPRTPEEPPRTQEPMRSRDDESTDASTGRSLVLDDSEEIAAEKATSRPNVLQ